MGFDWNLTIRVFVDEKTGMPWVWGPTGKPVPYTPEQWKLPKEFREFAIMRGNHLRAYTATIETEENRCEADTNVLLYYFPIWRNIQEDMVDYGWDEAKHIRFRACLEWCSEKGGYGATWSW